MFQSCMEFAKEGGVIDFTGNEEIDYWESICDEVRVCKGIRRLLEAGVSKDNFTVSSDGQGSLPVFNSRGEFQGLGVGKASCLLKEVKECVTREDIPLEIALRAVTSNPARILKLKKKGHILPDYHGDICLLREKDFSLHTVIAKGQVMVREGEAVVKGTFEKQGKKTGGK